MRRVVCASPDYLRRHGTPTAPQDLARHTVIAASAVSPTAEWRFFPGGQPLSVKVNPRLTVTNNAAAIQAALQGFGLTCLMCYQIAPQLAAGQLEIVLEEFEPPPLPIHVLHLEGPGASAKVRTFVDLLVGRLRADRALNR